MALPPGYGKHIRRPTPCPPPPPFVLLPLFEQLNNNEDNKEDNKEYVDTPASFIFNWNKNTPRTVGIFISHVTGIPFHDIALSHYNNSSGQWILLNTKIIDQAVNFRDGDCVAFFDTRINAKQDLTDISESQQTQTQTLHRPLRPSYFDLPHFPDLESVPPIVKASFNAFFTSLSRNSKNQKGNNENHDSKRTVQKKKEPILKIAFD
ncbi:MAG: hypothetical protein EZS28_011577 [Streblomastix strix]|uniref:Uncharacterized protein n=1 Tax=Streblomastix strix TaxID=222440 RepID=A0A5J4WDX3_9EUKA|nr:MAG: hypothetical protein EZS28_011577 [Streblomastix strix]